MGLVFSLTEQRRYRPSGDDGGLDAGHMLTVLGGLDMMPFSTFFFFFIVVCG